MRRRFFLSGFSGVSGGRLSSICSLLRLYGPPTSLDKLARLDLLLELPGLVLAGITAEIEAERSAENVVLPELEKRVGWPLNMVDALLVRDGTSSTEPAL